MCELIADKYETTVIHANYHGVNDESADEQADEKIVLTHCVCLVER
jgi:hypothetical protein